MPGCHNILVFGSIYFFKIGHFLRKKNGQFLSLTETNDFRLQSSFCFWLSLVTINFFGQTTINIISFF